MKIIKKHFRLLIAVIVFCCAISSFSLTAQAYYARSFSANTTLSGDPARDIVNVAMAHNDFKKDDFGYTTYWCAYFVSDCARAANISTEIIPSFAGCTPTVNAIRNNSWGKGTWHDGYLLDKNTTYVPQPGDIVFYSWDADYPKNYSDGVDHVGLIIAEPVNTYLQVIEGNTTNGSYSLAASKVVTYTNNYRRKTNSSCVVGYFTPNYCVHSFSSSNGHCTKCGALQPLQNSNASCTVGIYAANTTVYLRSDPYETGVGGANNCKVVLGKGTEVTVEGAVTNGIGNLWYKVYYGSESGYIYAPKLTYKRAVTGTISASSLSIPTNHKAGNGFHISGTISTKNCSITKARAYFCYSSNNQMVANSATSWYTYNTKSLSLLNSALDNNLKFGKLSSGSYYYCIEVQTDKAANGKTTNIFSSKTFTVGAMVVPAPSIWESSSGIGSKTYSISGTGSVRYRINSGNWVSGTSVTVNGSCYLEAQCVSGNTTSAITAISVNIPVLQEPTIQSIMNSSGATVTISADNGSTAYYSLNGGAYQQYYGAFTVDKASSVSAYSKKNGCITSNTVTASVKVSAPSTPTVARDTAADIAMGRAVTVHWNYDSLASSYKVTVTKDGKSWKNDTVTGTQYSFAADTAGSYEVSAVAVNVIGTSASSNKVKAIAHSPLKVTFEDFNGSALSVQTVPYGEAATRPSAPSRRGYTFSGWSTTFSKITADTVVKAEYEINVYSVKFYDVNGTTLLATQDITFDEPIDSAAVEKLVNVENGGRVFSGWYISNAAEDSERDLEHIDSDMKLTAVTAWGNEDLPVFVNNLSAILCYDKTNNVFNGYTVSCSVSTSDKKDINAKLIVTLLAEVDDGSGTMKMINTKVEPINLTASSNSISWHGDVLCDGTANADWVEVSVISVDGYDRTGGLISETKRIPITSEATRFWSEWMSASELNSAGHTISDPSVESKVQYSDRTNTKTTTTTSSSTPPSGYSLQSDNSYWGNWTGWSDTAVSSSSSRQVETRQTLVSQGYTQYRYGSWYNGSKSHFCGALISNPWIRYTDWSTTRYTQDKSDTFNYCSNYSHYTNGKHIGYKSYNGTTFYWAQWTIGGKNYYWEESQWIDTSYYKTQYRYRDYVGSYTYYKWDYGQWSDWKDTKLVDSDTSNPNYEVKTRTLYRYVVFDADDLPVDNSGTTQTVSGKLDLADGNLDNKHATILVYKSLNSDPTESQLEYVGQTVLGKDGSYNFTFRTKETVSEETGDFVIALSTEGSNGLLNVGLVKYERPSYTVTFIADNRTVSTQKVVKGESAIAPEVPAKEGYVFTGWSKSLTNITQNTTVVAQYKPKDCCVVFVDYLNQRCVITHYDYGTVFTVPAEMASPSYEGYDFMGWSYGNDASVSGDMIVSAIWKAKTYTVNFYDDDDQIVSSQTVAHGQSATPPETIHVDDKRMFLAWSDESNWWNVQSDVNVYPVVVYKETTAEPASGLAEYTDALYEELELFSNQDATIYYTLDGSDPDPEHVISATNNYSGDNGITKVYSDALELSEDAFVKAIAVSPDRNDSDISEFVFHYSEEIDSNSFASENELLAEQEVTVDAFDTVQVSVDLSTNPKLSAFSFYVNADPAVFFVDFDRETLEPMAEQGNLCADGGVITVGEYQEGVGWRIDWVGEPSTASSGTLLTVTLVSDGDTDSEKTPVSVSWIPGNILSSDNEEVQLDGLETVSIIASPHEHSYSETVTNATCTEKGKRDCVCVVCGGTYYEEIPALGHDIVADKAVAATCTATGLTAGEHCSRCDYKVAQEEIPVLGHDIIADKAVAATCTATGLTAGEHCSRCDYAIKQETVPALGHSIVADKAVAATCTATGLTAGEHCSRCDYKVEQEAVPALGHNIVTDKAVAATCTASGLTAGEHCSRCDYVVKQETVPALGHSIIVEKAVAATCTETGLTAGEYCTRCDYAVQQETIPALGHSIVADKAVAATCTAAGLTAGEHCSHCDYVVEQETIPALGHLIVADNAVEATCTENGLTEGEHCSRCDYAVKQEAIPALGHNTVTDNAVPATCTVPGLTAGEHCTRCNYATYEIIMALGHNYVDGTCSRCGEKDPTFVADYVVITADSVRTMPGETITVPVYIEGNTGFAGFTFTIAADEGLTLTKISKAGILLESESGAMTPNVAKGQVNWTDYCNEVGDGEILLLTFAVDENIADGDYHVRVALKDGKTINFVNEGDQIVPVRFVDGIVTVSSVVFGDLNGDGDISSGDSVKLARYLVDMEEFSFLQLAAADVNHDGEVTAGDAVVLAKYLVGLIDTLESSTSSVKVMSVDVPALNGVLIDVGTVSGQKGDIVSVPVSIRDNSGFAGFTLEILHDNDICLKAIRKGTLLKGSDSGAFTANAGKNLVNWTDSMDLCGDGVLMELTFELKEAGTYEIGLETKNQKATNFVNADGAVIEAELPGGDVIAMLNSFTDLPNPENWAYSGIDYCVRKATMKGVSDELFNPSGMVTRAQLVTILYRVAGEPDAAYEGTFTDVAAGKWYTNAVEWAFKNGIVHGVGNGRFAPDDLITREQIAAILYRYSGSPKVETSHDAFPDGDTVSCFAIDAMKWAVAEGLINGVKSGDTTLLSPKATATRAQIAAIIMRFMEK